MLSAPLLLFLGGHALFITPFRELLIKFRTIICSLIVVDIRGIVFRSPEISIHWKSLLENFLLEKAKYGLTTLIR